MSFTRLLVALALGCALLVPAPADAGDADYGRVARGDGVLRPGCHDYRFRYRVRPRHDDWSLELFLRGPGGTGLGTVAKDSDIHPERGRGRFEVCRQSTRPGRFRIRGKLSIYTEGQGLPLLGQPGETVEKWIKPARFRLRRSR